ncbi:MAG: GNAT family N-acetyltransferase [Calditrichia bacterium]
MKKEAFLLKYLDEGEWQKWDAFVGESPYGTIFQKSAYLTCLKQVFNRPVEIMAILHRDTIKAGIVVLPGKKAGISYCTTPFFLPYNGFILDSFNDSKYYYQRNKYQNHALSKLLSEINKRFSYSQFFLHPRFEDERPLVWRKWSIDPRYTVRVNLQGKTDLLKSVDRDQRRRIRNMEKEDFELSESKDPGLLYDMILQSYRKHAKKPPLQQRHYLELVSGILKKGFGEMLVLKKADKAVSAVLLVRDEPVVYALFSGRVMDPNLSGAEIYLFYLVMQRYRGQGYQTLDLLGAMEPAITKTKLELGGRLVRWDEARYFRNSVIRLLFNITTGWNKKQRKASVG